MAEESAFEMRLRKRTTSPYWWPEANTVMQFFLSVSIVCIVAYILYSMLSENALKIDSSVRDLVVFIFGIVFGNFKDVYGFTFGSSAGQKAQGETIRKSMDAKDTVIAKSVETAAKVAATSIANGTTNPATVITTVPTDPSVTATTTTVTTEDEPKPEEPKK